ncbi:phosphonate C-P lyase system protein PhnG [Aureimonas pseudogalii]|nr:phosphonate C-P lyase system protein PhnG [Aureimonas pseudogalii]
MDGLGTDPMRRKRQMEAVARFPAAELLSAYAAMAAGAPAARAVRGPEVGLVMVRGRAGGGGQPFHLGEASVVRATVMLDTGEVGHATILGRDSERARVAAHLDALWQRDDWRDRIEQDVVAPAERLRAQTERREAEEAEATRVDFFTLARGED